MDHDAATTAQRSSADPDGHLASTCEQALLAMAARLEGTLPGIHDAARRTQLRVRHRPGKSLGQFQGDAHGPGRHEIQLNSHRGQGHFNGQRPGEDAVVTLAHELAHLYAFETGVQDTDESAVVHNQEFARIARSAGCSVIEKSDGGHGTPSLNKEGRALFSDLVAEMERAFQIYNGLRGAARRATVTPSTSPSTLINRKEPLMSNSLVPISSLPSAPISTGLTVKQQRQTLAAIESVQLGGAMAALTDDVRHRLAMRAMENVALLSGLEGHYLAASPLSEARIKAIVDAYAISAANAVQRFGR